VGGGFCTGIGQGEGFDWDFVEVMAKGWADPRRGLSVALRDGGSMEGVQFSNIAIQARLYGRFWWGGGEPIHVTAMPRDAATQARARLTPEPKKP
jgi:hypothetical protein